MKSCKKALCVRWLPVAVMLLLAAGACVYDPPPEILSSTPAIGDAITCGDNIVIRFTEPIGPETLEVTLFPHLVDAEKTLLPDVTPIAGPCRPDGECPGATLNLEENDTLLTLDPDEDLSIGAYLFRLAPGLADLDGNQTDVPLDIAFYASPIDAGDEPTTFQPGVVMIWIDLDKPFSFPLEIYWDIQVEQETGKIWGAACDGDPKDPDTVKRDQHVYSEWIPAPYASNGYHFIFTGHVWDIELPDGNGGMRPGYFLATDEFYILNVSTPQVEVMDGSVMMTIVRDEELGREVVIDGGIYSNETYIFDPEHEFPYDDVSGLVYGYRLTEEEVAAERKSGAAENAWKLCFSMEDVPNFP